MNKKKLVQEWIISSLVGILILALIFGLMFLGIFLPDVFFSLIAIVCIFIGIGGIHFVLFGR